MTLRMTGGIFVLKFYVVGECCPGCSGCVVPAAVCLLPPVLWWFWLAVVSGWTFLGSVVWFGICWVVGVVLAFSCPCRGCQLPSYFVGATAPPTSSSPSFGLSCMSSQAPISSSEVQDLISALTRLSLALETYNSVRQLPQPSATSSPVEPEVVFACGESWTVVEESEKLPRGYTDPRIYRIVEDGPGPTPPALLSLGRTRLTGVEPGFEARVRRAYVAGFWAWAASTTNSEYVPAEPIPLADSRFVVLRSWTLDPRVVRAPFQVERKSDLKALLGDLSAPGAIIQGFASLTEVQVFCGGACIEIPALYQCKGKRRV